MPEFNSDSLVALFSVTKSYGEFLKNEASHNVPRERGLYEATRGKWQISPEKRKEIKYAAAVYTAPGSRCEIVQVYRVHDWHTAGTSEKYKTRPELNEEAPGFLEFDGTPADDVGKRLIGYRHSMSYEKEYKRLGELLNLSNTPPREDSMIDTAIELLRQFYQIIFHGPPGTGKTHCATQLLPKLLELPDSTPQQLRNEGRWDIVQFHPSYNYEDFVRGVQVKTENNQVIYKTLDRTFGEMCRKANDAPKEKKFALIIDEINRANVSAVLGELIYALEYRGHPVNTPYDAGDGKALTIPENLYVIGTMNTADRTIGQIDYAVRRRFAFVACPPDKEVIRKHSDTDDDSRDFFRRVNKIFNGHISPDFDAADVRVGHSYFLAAGRKLGYKLVYQVVPILREYVKDGVLQESAKPEIDEIETAAKDLLQGKPQAGESAKPDSSAKVKKGGRHYFYWRNGDRYGVGDIDETAFCVIRDFVDQNPSMTWEALFEEFADITPGNYKCLTLVNFSDPGRFIGDTIDIDKLPIRVSAEWENSFQQWNAFKEKVASHGYSIGQCHVINLGEGKKPGGQSRCWELCREHNFISCRGKNYTTAVHNLRKGDFLFVNLVGTADQAGGVVACGEVVAEAEPIENFRTAEGLSLGDLPVEGGESYKDRYPDAFSGGDDGMEHRERIVAVRWVCDPRQRNDGVGIDAAPGQFRRAEIQHRVFRKLHEAFNLPGHAIGGYVGHNE